MVMIDYLKFKSLTLDALTLKTISFEGCYFVNICRIVGYITLSFSISACITLPKAPHIEATNSLNERLEQRFDPDSDVSKVDEKRRALNQSIKKITEKYPNQSGYHPIINGTDAFVYRNVLTSAAIKSIDVQYYIWHNDTTGQLMLKALWDAAENGVIVRFLLDDFNSSSELDQRLIQFASHPNIAVRVINPMVYRKFKALNFVTSLKRINRRMHNKSMTFDRQLSIVGGRNIGDEYLSNNNFNQFADIDVLLVGPVVENISNSFNDYWHSSLSYDLQTLVKSQIDLETDEYNNKSFINSLDKLTPNHGSGGTKIATTYNTASIKSTIDADINKKLSFRWAPITFLTDEVSKISGNANPDDYLVHQLRELLGKPNKKLTIVSSYFVPTRKGVDTLVKLSKQGVQISILTNSYHATDVSAVHAGYSEWRKKLLKSGIDLYEIKAIVSEEVENTLWRGHSKSSNSLHAKMFAVDDENVFIGSYNVDPRSADMNTEMGVVIKDSSLANMLHLTVSEDLMSHAYKVILTDNNNLQWLTEENHKIVTFDSEPNMDVGEFIWIKLMSLLPVDWLL